MVVAEGESKGQRGRRSLVGVHLPDIYLDKNKHKFSLSLSQILNVEAFKAVYCVSFGFGLLSFCW